MKPREQKLTPEALAMLFQDRCAANAASSGIEEWDRPRPWVEIPEARKALLIEVFRQLQGLFIDESDPGTIFVSSIVSHKTHEGRVQVQFGSMGGQLSPDEARALAQEFMESAESAETDSIVYEILHGFESPKAEILALNFIVNMRDLREKRRIDRLQASTPPGNESPR